MPLTDAQRLEAVREIWAHAAAAHPVSGFDLLYSYERKITEGRQTALDQLEAAAGLAAEEYERALERSRDTVPAPAPVETGKHPVDGRIV